MRQLPREELDRSPQQGTPYVERAATYATNLNLEQALTQRLPAPQRVAECEIEPGWDLKIEYGRLPDLDS